MSKKTSIAKSDLSPKILAKLREAGLSDMRVGDVYSVLRYGDDSAYYRLDKIDKDGRGKLEFHFSEWDGEKWDDTHDYSVQEFKDKDPIKVDKTIEQIEREAIDALQNLDALEPEQDGLSTDTGLMIAGGKAHVLAIQAAVEERKNRVELIRRSIAMKVERLNDMVSAMHNQLKEIGKVVGALELYLGVNEEIVLVRDGLPAPDDTPISIRQLTLFMDEEVGDADPKYTGQRGIDFQNVEEFDAWVSQPGNFTFLMPEPKGIVAIRPTRQEREYHPDNPWVDAMLKANNLMTYLLIRNGERLYRIWTGINVGKRLYPSAGEMEKVFSDAEQHSYFETEKAKDREFDYKKNALLLQGIVDRTDVLKPMSHLVNLFDPDTYDGLVQFIRDAEPSLTTGHETYKVWKDRINAEIKRGTRVFLAPVNWYRKYDSESRFLHSYPEHCAPPRPKSGVYTVEEVQPPRKYRYETQDGLVIRYNPGDRVGTRGWTWNPHERKNRLAYVLFENDDFVLNYDLLDLESVEWFLKDRIEREHYLAMMPVLRGIRAERLKELEWEKHFVALVAGRCGCDESKVWEAVTWWKNKVIWKRPIRQDDAKALRMIERRVKGEQEIDGANE